MLAGDVTFELMPPDRGLAIDFETSTGTSRAQDFAFSLPAIQQYLPHGGEYRAVFSGRPTVKESNAN